MPANPTEMKKVLATAIFDQEFRKALTADPEKAVARLNVKLSDQQIGFLKEATSRLVKADDAALANFKITATKEMDHMGELNPLAFHGSTSISW